MTLALVACLALGAPAESPAPDFSNQILPILEQNCISCHKGDKNEGGLDMTTLEHNLKGGDTAASIVGRV